MLRATGAAHWEQTIRRSRFIGDAVPVRDRSGAEQTISQRRAEYPDATHVVYAYSVGGDKERQFGMSDAGEPKGTAGRPVLDILRGSEVTDCLITVVRYFGGTKLGTGGLVHAYGAVAKECMLALPTEVLEDRVQRTITVPYDIYDSVVRLLEEASAQLISQDFGSQVTVTFDCPTARLEEVRQGIRDFSRGTIDL